MKYSACPCCGGSLRVEEDDAPAWILADLLRLDPRLDGRIETDSEAGCWIWTGYAQKSGSKGNAVYGRLKRGGVLWYIHRWVYRLLVGPIPEDHHVHHTCLNTLCCNPRHMETIEAGEHEWLHREMTASELEAA